MKRIVMTGGGSAGHVTPNIAIMPRLKKLGYDIQYIGTDKGMERKLIEAENIPYYSIKAGKLRRYFDLKNFTDTFKIVHGFNQALILMKKLKPDVVFSKGGFVSCPVVWAAWICKIPVVIHESDYTVGLANKLSMRYAKTICYTFPETKKYLTKHPNIFLTGIPVRETLYNGNAEKGKELCGFKSSKPIIVVIGGSLGSGVINAAVRGSLTKILDKFQVCHICGKNGIDKKLEGIEGYKQFEYLNKELPDVFAMADMFISRAGATVLFELLGIKKPNLLIPLSKQASRGDQILDARSFEKQGFSRVLMEENLNKESLIKELECLYANRGRYIKAMSLNSMGNSIDKVVEIIENAAKRKR